MRTGLPGPAKALDPGPLVNREAWEVEPEEPAPLPWDSPAPPQGPRGDWIQTCRVVVSPSPLPHLHPLVNPVSPKLGSGVDLPNAGEGWGEVDVPLPGPAALGAGMVGI